MKFDKGTLIIAGGAALAFLLFAASARSSGQPAPGPGPGPGPAPNPNPNVDILRSMLNNLLVQADLAPGTVDPSTMDVLAAQLQDAGLTQEAATLKAKAEEVRRKQGIPVT